MIDVHSLEDIGRKELQALAKEHGIKANQKSALLRDELRAVLLKDIADQTEVPINASEENLTDAIAEDTLAKKPGSDSEAVNVDERKMEDFSPTEPTEEYATSIVQLKDTPAEESPSGSEVAKIADDRIELSFPHNASEENVHNATVQSKDNMSAGEPTSSSEVANIDDQEWEIPVEERDQKEESPSSSDVVNVADDRIELSSPDNASEEYVQDDTVQSEHNMSAGEPSSGIEVASVDGKAWKNPVDERDQKEESPSSSEVATVTDDRIELSSVVNASEENVHNNTVQSRQSMSTEEPASSTEVAIVDDQAWENPVDEKDQEKESPSCSVANVADDRIELSSPDNASEENAHNGAVQSEDSMSAGVPASSSREEANVDDQEIENPVDEKEKDGYGEILQSEHILGEKSPDDVIRLPSVEVEVFSDESVSTLIKTHVSFSEGTKFALVDEGINGSETDVTQDKSFEETTDALAKKEVAADFHEPKESHLIDRDSENDTNRSGITAAAGFIIATKGRQHQEKAVQKKAKSSVPMSKVASTHSRKRPLSKGEQMSFGFSRKEIEPLPSMSAISSSQASTQKIVSKKAKASLLAWKTAAEDFRKRPASRGKNAMARKDSKPRVPLQTLSNHPQQDNPKSFIGNTKRPVQMSMSERNQKQLRKFLDRQAAAREERAKKAVPPEFHRA